MKYNDFYMQLSNYRISMKKAFTVIGSYGHSKHFHGISHSKRDKRFIDVIICTKYYDKHYRIIN